MPRITISEPGRTPQPYRLKTDREVTKIGRGSDNDIIIESGSASSYHCEMHRVEGGFILKDNDSTNGILLEDRHFKTIDLIDGIEVRIGEDIDFSFELSEEELELLEEEGEFESKQQAAFPKSKPKEKKKAVALVEEEDEDDEEDEYEEVVVRRKKKAVALVDDDEDDDDFEEDEEVVKPKKSIARSEEQPRRSNASSEVAKTGGIGTTLLFVILAVVCLVAGMAVRHYQDHGKSLFENAE